MTPRKRRQRLDSIHEIADQLRQSAAFSTPDLTDSILDRVGDARPFLDRRTRHLLWVGRTMVGLSVAAVGLGVALTHRWAPEAVDLVSASNPAPLSSVVESVRSEAGERLVTLRVAVDQAGQAVDAGAASVPSGGLLTLVTSAAPALPAASVTRGCTICGPMIPPGEAARLVPSSMLAKADVASSATTLQPGARFQIGLASFRMDVAGLTGIHAGGGKMGEMSGLIAVPGVGSTSGRPGRSVLDELAPLGIGPSADSVLAPK